MKVHSEAKFLLVTSIFPPINGGSAVVYDNVCRYAVPGTAYVLTTWRDYRDGNEIDGFAEFDRKANYKIDRIELLRPTYHNGNLNLIQKIWVFLTEDIIIKIKAVYKITCLIKKEKIKVVCIGELVSGSWIGLFCKRFLGCKVINFIHGEEITTVITWGNYGSRRKDNLAKADAVVAVSNFTRSALINLMQVNPEKIELITNGVDTSRFYAGPKSQYVIEKFGLQGKRILLSVGRLVERKGFDMTIKALPSILEECPNIQYVIVGTGEYFGELKKLAAENGVTDNITFAGKVNEKELIELYQTCDLFIMPNRELSDKDTEGFGLVFLEANACGRAVIGGRAGGVVDAIQEGKNGLLVNGWDIADIKRAVVTLMNDESLRSHIEAEGWKVAQMSSSKYRAEQFQALCTRLANS